MQWFGGSIAEAVNQSKQQNTIFVVFVEGDNDLSVEMTALIDDEMVLSRLSNPNDFLAIKLKSGSPNYTHFAQIYQFVPVPSLFFIGKNGTPLEVVCAGVQPKNLACRIDKILMEHSQLGQPTLPPAPSVQPSTSSLNVREQTVNLLQAETSHKPEPPTVTPVVEPERESDDSSEPASKIQKTEHHDNSKSTQEYELVCDGDVCVRKPKVPESDEAGPSQNQPTEPTVDPPINTEDNSEESSVSMEEKLERAKEMIEARRREKVQKEKELEKQKEIERRAQGQGVAELKKWQQEQELKQIQEERKREKMENNLARQRILEQIAQDRAERRARDLPSPVNAQPPVVPPTQAQQVPTSGDGSSRARIQFKLPDGTSHTAHFEAEDTLGDVQRYIADNLQLANSSFSIWTAFPRRELVDVSASLRGLQLAPSAALLVLPRRESASVASPTAVSSLITLFTHFFSTFILEPTQQLYAWVRARLFPPPPANSTPTAPPTRRPSPPPGIRRRGNIHRLPGERSPEDDNNTWNGNSTQQM